jgi:hypothetical protein
MAGPATERAPILSPRQRVPQALNRLSLSPELLAAGVKPGPDGGRFTPAAVFV